MKIAIAVVILLAASLFVAFQLTASPDAVAEYEANLPAKKISDLHLYMTPEQAFERMETQGDKTLFVDIRTRPELQFLGTPSVMDANIPWMVYPEQAWGWNEKKNVFQLAKNTDFAEAMEKRLTEKGLTKEDVIILMCRSGDRSAKAASYLATLGYTKVYSIDQGYEGDKAKEGETKGQRTVNGWKNAGMPWSYKLDKAKMYFPAQ